MPMNNVVNILYFASLREELGCSGEKMELGEDIKTIGDLRQALAGRDKKWGALNDESTAILASVNQEMVSIDHPVKPGDEVAFFPPVTGG